ncbi:MAG: PTS sugar transporter subunit IIA [Rubrivivax sp.]
MASVLIIAHAPLASALKAVAGHVYAERGPTIEALDVPSTATPDEVQAQARALMARASGPDWLVLTDVFGATPCNAAQRLADPAHVRVLTGVNVPMLWRALCYADEALDALATRALGGAVQGVLAVAPTRPPNQSTAALARDPACDHLDHRHQ